MSLHRTSPPMTTKHSTAPAPADTQPLPRTLTALRMEAVANGVLAGCIVAGAVAAAVYFEQPTVALFGLAGAWFALRARWLWGDVQRMAEHLPQRPPRTRPHWLRRLWWWFARRQVQRAARPKPWRGVSVDGQADAIKLPRQPQEMAQTQEPAVVHGYTASDVYFITCRASTYGLGERATDEYQRRVWTWDAANKIKLPSGRHLSRTGFRAVQDWLVSHKLAVSQPAYQLTVTPEAVAAELEKD
jgi:hypothetical protein